MAGRSGTTSSAGTTTTTITVAWGLLRPGRGRARAPCVKGTPTPALRCPRSDERHPGRPTGTRPGTSRRRVTLDKVICCYPDLPALVSLLYVVPRDGAVVRAVVRIGNWVIRNVLAGSFDLCTEQGLILDQTTPACCCACACTGGRRPDGTWRASDRYSRACGTSSISTRSPSRLTTTIAGSPTLSKSSA